MTFFDEIDQDKLLIPVVGMFRRPFPFWINRYFNREEFFLDELFRIARDEGPLSLDVGLRKEIQMLAWIFPLHRAGPRQGDEFGSDFAITLDVVGTGRWIKTALFQVKTSENQSLNLERDQLEEAIKEPRLKDRAFVMAADRARLTIRIEETARLLGAFPTPTQKSHVCDASVWHPSTEWMRAWLRCDTGVLSDPLDLWLERLLNSYAIRPGSEYFEYDDQPRSAQDMGITAKVLVSTSNQPKSRLTEI